ncbi:MAG: general secretion pathway protein GspK [Alphaproteobacteria bacterium]|nr:general secretion pathway protein GspK [Alphaproteobacteria bacterium]
MTAVRRGRLGRRGGALIVVVSGVALLAALALGAMSLTRSSAAGLRGDIDAAAARHAAASGLALALAALLDGDGRNLPPTDGQAVAFSFGAARLAVAISDEAGRIDLNVAPAALLAGAFAMAGLEPSAARVMAEAVIARRERARLSHAAELLGLGPISAEQFTRLTDAVTVHGHTAGIDPRLAPRAALAAIPGLDARDIDSYLATRHRLGATPPAAGRAFFTNSPASAYRVAVDAELPNRARHGVIATVRLTQEPRRPYVILAWR